MKKMIFIALMGLVLISCDKNQKAVKTLDGTWNATSYTLTNGTVTQEYISQGLVYKMAFTNCKLKDDKFCDVTLTVSSGEDTETENIRYRVTSDGTKLQFIDDNDNVNQFKIVELKKSDLTLEVADDDVTATFILKKV